MPNSSPVYQPTTVTYEQQNDWTPISYLSQTVNGGFRRSRCVQWLLLALGTFSLITGLIMIIECIINIHTPTESEIEAGKIEEEGNIAVPIIGATLIGIGIMLLGAYLTIIGRKIGCLCFTTKEQRLARQLDNQVGNGQILTLNPSTDLLVTAQYAPVSEIAYQPPAVSEEEETRKLMGNDIKECPAPTLAAKIRKISSQSNSFPRIQAPLAKGEEITPSLCSSFASMYYNITPYNSDEEDEEVSL